MEEWQRSSFCDTGTCVEVTFDDPWVLLRNSQDVSVQLRFTADEWLAFLNGAKEAEFDL